MFKVTAPFRIRLYLDGESYDLKAWTVPSDTGGIRIAIACQTFSIQEWYDKGMQILMNQKYTHDFPISQSDIVNLMVGDPKKAFEAIQAHLAGISTQDKAYVMRIQRAYDKLVMVLDFVKLIFANEAAFDAAQAKAAKPTKPKAKKAK